LKLVVPIAVLIVLAAIILVSARVGVGIGRTREASKRQGIDPKWAAEAEAFLGELVAPPAPMAAAEDMVVLPAKMLETGKRLAFEAPEAAARRQRLRIIGY
jgi:hypothetical protein